MTNFNLGPLLAWRQVSTGEVLDFPVPAVGVRNVDFDVVADTLVSVRAVSGDDAWLVGHGEGLLNCKFSIHQSVGIVVTGDPDAVVFIRTHVDSQVIPESLDPSYTSIEPRPAGPSEEVRRMMMMVKINEQRRNQQLQEALDRLEASNRPDPVPNSAPSAPETGDTTVPNPAIVDAD